MEVSFRSHRPCWPRQYLLKAGSLSHRRERDSLNRIVFEQQPWTTGLPPESTSASAATFRRRPL